MKAALRRATPGDSGLLYDWVNEPDSLAGKLLTSGPIDRATHEAWFATRLADPDTFIWIVESDHKPIGQLRLMKRDDAFEVDIYVVGNARRAGLAHDALLQGIATLRVERQEARVLRARVKADNVSSQRLFEGAGFVLTARNADHLVYDLTL